MSTPGDFWAHVRALIREELAHHADGGSRHTQDGLVVPGSWNPKDETISVTLLENESAFLDDTNRNEAHQRIVLHAPIAGSQGGPVGGERVHLHRTESGVFATLAHREDDAVGVPAGETWFTQVGAAIRLRRTSGGRIEIDSGTVRLGPETATHYALVRVVDIAALVTQLNTHIHGPGDGTNTGMPVIPFTNPGGSPNVSSS